jgi:hypothetical protein
MAQIPWLEVENLATHMGAPSPSTRKRQSIAREPTGCIPNNASPVLKRRQKLIRKLVDVKRKKAYLRISLLCTRGELSPSTRKRRLIAREPAGCFPKNASAVLERSEKLNCRPYDVNQITTHLENLPAGWARRPKPRHVFCSAFAERAGQAGLTDFSGAVA